MGWTAGWICLWNLWLAAGAAGRESGKHHETYEDLAEHGFLEGPVYTSLGFPSTSHCT